MQKESWCSRRMAFTLKPGLRMNLIGKRENADMSEEKRKNPRIDLYVQVRIKHQGLHKVKDLSISGLFVQTPHPSHFKKGDEIELVLQLPEENQPTRLDARVARVTPDGIGVEFKNVPAKEQVALEYCFNLFKHTIPLPGS
jgi:hypothetical protein